MKHDMDALLTQALSPEEEPDFWLNQKIIGRAKEKEEMTESNRTESGRIRSNEVENKARGYGRRRRYRIAALVAVLTLTVGSATAFAAWKFLEPKAVAESVEDQGLAAAFSGADAISINATQTFDQYQITLLGVVSGNRLSDYVSEKNGVVATDRTYCVVAIEKTDGTPMPDTSDPDYGTDGFFVSPLIQGYNPSLYNIVTMGGGYTEFVQDGIQYRLTECDNVEIFANQQIYLCVNSGTFYDQSAFQYNEATGEITQNAEYQAVNALFKIQLDQSKADPAAAEAYINELNKETFGESEEGQTYDEVEMSDIDQWVAQLTPENIDEYAMPVESSRMTVTPGADGGVYVEYNVNGMSGSGIGCFVEQEFQGMTSGMSPSFGYSYSDDELSNLIIQTYTLNEDGTVTFVIYVPRM